MTFDTNKGRDEKDITFPNSTEISNQSHYGKTKFCLFCPSFSFQPILERLPATETAMQQL